MRVAVLGSSTSWHFADLARAAEGRCELVAASFEQLASSVTHSHLGVSDDRVELHAYDAVIVRSMAVGTLEQIVFRMDALAQLEATGLQVINPAKAIETAVDKYLATCRLRDAGLRVPKTFACQTATAALEAFDQLGGDAVLKPLFGGEGRGVERLQNTRSAEQIFREHESRGAVVYLQEFIPHIGRDLRLLVVGDRVLGMQRMNDDDWRTNISRGARAAPLFVTEGLAETARKAAAAVGAVVAGVDLLPGEDGRMYAIEVNAIPGWRALSTCTGVDVASLVIELATGQLPADVEPITPPAAAG